MSILGEKEEILLKICIFIELLECNILETFWPFAKILEIVYYYVWYREGHFAPTFYPLLVDIYNILDIHNS